MATPVSLGHAGELWGEASAQFRATQDTDNATLNIDFEGPGTLWLDRIYLIGEDAVLGIWRPDVVAALKAMNPGVIRFGGTAIESYEWDQSIGPWNERVPFTTWWGGLERCWSRRACVRRWGAGCRTTWCRLRLWCWTACR